MKIFEWLRSFFRDNDFSKETTKTIEKVRKRARDARGRFKADDPSTKENEAYEKEFPTRD
tara:strand:- start:86 stop:265 length:180 start_codon:yes stop_codon:yes gene_type:complete